MISTELRTGVGLHRTEEEKNMLSSYIRI